jgi:hypothetical protein
MAGVLFIPAHLVEEVVINAEKSHIRDTFGFDRLGSGTYTSAQIDTMWTVEMFDDFINWIATDERGTAFRHLEWETDRQKAIEHYAKLTAEDKPTVRL